MTQAPTVIGTTVEELTLEPKLRRQIVQRLREYAAVTAELKVLQARARELAAILGNLRDETGETSLRIEGEGTITLVAPTYKKFNPKRFVSLGGYLKIYEQAIDEKPKKAFNKISLPGQKDDEGEE